MRRIMPPGFTGVKPRNKSHSAAIKQKRRLTDTISWLVYQQKWKTVYNPKSRKNVKFKLNFITVTLPATQVHSDSDIKIKVFRPFLDSLRRKFKVNSYIWRAEKQKNGNLHFHIITGTWVDWLELRNVWNNCTEKLGYLSRFISKHGSVSPNSTDVKSTKKIKKVGAYLAKYMAKGVEGSSGDGGRVVKGRIWGCSENLSKMKAFIIERSDLINRTLNRYFHSFKDKVYNYEYSTLFAIDFGNWKEAKEVGVIKRRFDEWIRAGDWDLFNSIIEKDEGREEKKREVGLSPSYAQASLYFKEFRLS